MPGPCCEHPRKVHDPFGCTADGCDCELVSDIEGPKPAQLSPRELEAIRWSAQGLTRAAIGERMGVAEGTVASLMHRARVRLGARNVQHAMVLAIQFGLITVKPERGQ